MIPKNKLIRGSWYKGRGRGSNVAIWTGKDFCYIEQKYDQWVAKFSDHFEDGPPYGCFSPLKLVAPYPKPQLYSLISKVKPQQPI